MIEEAILEGRRLAHENRLEGKDLDELDELEDEEDEAFLEQYRQKRMAELNSLQKKALHGTVYPLSKPEYQREVTDARICDRHIQDVGRESCRARSGRKFARPAR